MVAREQRQRSPGTRLHGGKRLPGPPARENGFGKSGGPRRGPGRIKGVKRKGSSLKNQIRGVQRLLAKPELDRRVRSAQETKLCELQAALSDKQRADRERKYAIRYRRIRFFERQKIERRIRKLRAQAGEGGALDDAQMAQLQRLKEDLMYVTHFPKGEKYVSLLVDAATPEAQAELDAKRSRLRAMVAGQLAQAAMLTEAHEGLGVELPAVKQAALAIGAGRAPQQQQQQQQADKAAAPLLPAPGTTPKRAKHTAVAAQARRHAGTAVGAGAEELQRASGSGSSKDEASPSTSDACASDSNGEGEATAERPLSVPRAAKRGPAPAQTRRVVATAVKAAPDFEDDFFLDSDADSDDIKSAAQAARAIAAAAVEQLKVPLAVSDGATARGSAAKRRHGDTGESFGVQQHARAKQRVSLPPAVALAANKKIKFDDSDDEAGAGSRPTTAPAAAASHGAARQAGEGAPARGVPRRPKARGAAAPPQPKLPLRKREEGGRKRRSKKK